MRPATLIYNPKSGRWLAENQLAEIVELLRDAGWSTEPHPTRGPGDATLLARQAATDGAGVVFAVGGDGTLREVAKGLLGTSTALGPLPAGTTNVLAYELGIPRQPLAAAAAMKDAQSKLFDVGLCGDEPFLMMTSAGLDAEVMAMPNSALKRRFGPAAIAWTGLRRALTYGYPEIEVHTDAGETLRGSLVVVANISRFGGPFKIAPNALPNDGELDLVVFEGSGFLATAAFVGKVLARRHTRSQRVQTRRIRQAELRLSGGARLQIDGDTQASAAVVRIRLASRQLPILTISR